MSTPDLSLLRRVLEFLRAVPIPEERWANAAHDLRVEIRQAIGMPSHVAISQPDGHADEDTV